MVLREEGRSLGNKQKVDSGRPNEKVSMVNYTYEGCGSVLEAVNRKDASAVSEGGEQSVRDILGIVSGAKHGTGGDILSGLIDEGGREMEGVELDSEVLVTREGEDTVRFTNCSPTKGGMRRWKRAARKGSSPKFLLGISSSIKRMLEARQLVRKSSRGKGRSQKI
ncbi:hypothetical protein ACOSQ4_006389 [Xanthoceras sorbifolium]